MRNVEVNLPLVGVREVIRGRIFLKLLDDLGPVFIVHLGIIDLLLHNLSGLGLLGLGGGLFSFNSLLLSLLALLENLLLHLFDLVLRVLIAFFVVWGQSKLIRVGTSISARGSCLFCCFLLSCASIVLEYNYIR